MITHVTDKLRKKLKLSNLEKTDLKQNLFLHWYATLFRVGHTQYILTTHEASLLSFVFEGRGIISAMDYMQWMLCKLSIYLEAIGCRYVFDDIIVPGIKDTLFVKTNNRSVLGSMNDMVYGCQVMADYKNYTIAAMTDFLNKTPMGSLKYALPKDVFVKMAQATFNEKV